jgi:cellulose synthase operon protein B
MCGKRIILGLMAVLTVFLFGAPSYAAGVPSNSPNTSSSALTAEQQAQKVEGDRLTAEAKVSKTKADALVAAGKLNKLNSDYVDMQLFSQTVHLSMPKNTASYWFRIPTGTSVNDSCYLNLDMTFSSTLIDNRSSISLAVNGTSLETTWIYDVAKNKNTWWKVSVPASLLKMDGSYNEITITTTQRSIEGDCADIDNPSNWVRFDPDSYFHLAVQKYAIPNLGNLYSSFFDNVDDDFSIKNEFVLPANPDTSAVNKMLKIASAIGAGFQTKDSLKFKVSLGAATDDSIKNRIFLGLLNKWTQNKALTLPSGLSADQGYLSINGNNALITGQNEAGLQKSTNFFANSAYLNQIESKDLVVQTSIPDSAVHLTPNDTGNYTFNDFGYNDINLAGAFHQSTTLTFTQPSGVRSGEASYVNVKFRHSKALYADNSLLTVYFNNVAYGSVKLSGTNADSGEIKVRIPKDVLADETINVKIDVYNYIGKIDCSKDWYDTAWTVIDKSSQIYFEPGKSGVAPTLINFPSFNMFTADGKKNILMGTTEANDQDMLTIMSLLSTKAGQNNGNIFDFSVCGSPKNINTADEQSNMIFVGSYGSINLPDKISAALSVAPTGANSFKIAKDLTISPETLQNKIVIQVIRSPWDFNKKIYVITYDKNIEKNVIDFLSDKTLTNQLTGHLSVIDTQGNAVSYSLETGLAPSDNVPLSYEYVKYIIEKQTGLPLWTIVLIILLIVISIVLLIKVLRNKKRFKQAAEKMRRNIEDEPVINDQTNKDIHFAEIGVSNEGFENNIKIKKKVPAHLIKRNKVK